MWKMCLIGAIAILVAVLLLAGLAAPFFVTLLSGDGKHASVAVPRAVRAGSFGPWPLDSIRALSPGDVQDNPAIPGSSCILTFDNGAPPSGKTGLSVPLTRSWRSAGWTYGLSALPGGCQSALNGLRAPIFIRCNKAFVR